MRKNPVIPYQADTPMPAYLPFPRFLIQNESLCLLSNDAKVLYALLLDRASLSKENGYLEPDGRVRLYFTVEEAKKSYAVAVRWRPGSFGAGSLRLDRAKKAGPGPARENHAEYPARHKEGRA